ncbi:MAG: HAMP domain-containing sensor histidine kinase [Ancalomicrobiaceae bacterium]|nr:HAMP domain-containing sensor histidine kinase [Ancalomicrobiaceae bacterium]
MDEGKELLPPSPDEPQRRWPRFGLSSKLLVLTIIFVMAAEFLVLVPTFANFRSDWLRDRLTTADIVSLSLSEMKDVPRRVQDKLLAATGAMMIAVRETGARRLVAMAEMPPTVSRHIDMADRNMLHDILDAFDTILAGNGRTIHVLGTPNASGQVIELVISETPLRDAMLRLAGAIFWLSAAIAVISAALVYFSLRGLLLQPLLRLTRAMATFSARPEDPSSIIVPSGRHDEIGDAERHLAGMQTELAGTLQQKSHLADLGLAVSKINHDLRNMLASAQLLTERLATISDPTVQRFAPKLLASLDRAIGYSQAVLNYGKAREAPPERRLVSLRRVVDDVGDVLGLYGHASIEFAVTVATDIEIDVDPDHLFRVLMNLCRNAAQALEADVDPAIVKRIMVEAGRAGSVVTIRIADTGPGVPPRARENLFRAFQGGVRRGGTGLGLAICAELVRAHGGAIDLVDTGAGAAFEISIPDRVIELKRGRRSGTQ